MDLNKEINLIQGDCLEKMKEIPDKSINLVLIDPPYNINKADWDKWKTVNAYVEFMGRVFLECQRVLKDNGSFYFFHNDINQIVELLYWIKNNTKFKLKNQITWHKFNNWKGSNIKEGAGMYRSILQCYGNQRTYNNSTTEYIYYFTFQDDTGLDVINSNVYCYREIKDYLINEKEKMKMSTKNIIELSEKYLGKKNTGISHYFSDSQFRLPTENVYKKYLQVIGKKYGAFEKEYEELRQEYEELRYVFNQPVHVFKNTTIENKKDILRPYTTVWEFDRDEAYYLYNHLTPKPVEMLEHIIKT